MRDRNGRVRRILGLGAAIALAAGRPRAAEPKIRTISAGLSYDNFSRTVVWKGDAAASRILANLVSARADLGLGKSVVLSLTRGVVPDRFQGPVLHLPAHLPAIRRGAHLGPGPWEPRSSRRSSRYADFEISGTGRFVYSLGMSKTWPLEGFAVEGEATGKPSWMEAAVGPRVSYLFFGRVVPYVEVCARWLRADFKMTETLSDLGGTREEACRGRHLIQRRPGRGRGRDRPADASRPRRGSFPSPEGWTRCFPSGSFTSSRARRGP